MVPEVLAVVRVQSSSPVGGRAPSRASSRLEGDVRVVLERQGRAVRGADRNACGSAGLSRVGKASVVPEAGSRGAHSPARAARRRRVGGALFFVMLW